MLGKLGTPKLTAGVCVKQQTVPVCGSAVNRRLVKDLGCLYPITAEIITIIIIMDFKKSITFKKK